VASIIIKGPEEANLEQNVEGDKEDQEEFAKKIADIETNRMYAWSDMPQVKKELWNKLHQVKSVMKEKVTNLAQTMVNQVQNSVGYLKDPIQHYYSKPSNFKQEQPLFLAQTQESEVPEYGSRSKLGDTGVSSTKQMNTRGTLLLYFCIMTVLTCCCLGRCLIVPLT
jgi:hypothetical protein